MDLVPRRRARLAGLVTVAVLGLVVPAGSVALSGSADAGPPRTTLTFHPHAGQVAAHRARGPRTTRTRPAETPHGPSDLGGHLCEDNGPARDT